MSTHIPESEISLENAELVAEIKNSSLSDFTKLVYLATIRIPVGHVSTYKLIAEAIDHPHSARAVGNALRLNPYAPKVPCHRVVSSNGKVGGFFGDSGDSEGVRRKIALLESENIRFNGMRIMDWGKVRMISLK